MQDKNPARQHMEVLVWHLQLCWHLDSKGLRNSLLSGSVAHRTHKFSLKLTPLNACSFPCWLSPHLEPLISWGLHCNSGFTFPGPCSVIFGAPCTKSDPATHCLASRSFSNLNASFHNPLSSHSEYPQTSPMQMITSSSTDQAAAAWAFGTTAVATSEWPNFMYLIMFYWTRIWLFSKFLQQKSN